MKKLILIAAIALSFAACHSGERRCKVSEVFTDAYTFKYKAVDEVRIMYVDTLLHAGDVFEDGGTMYMVR